MRLKIIFLMTVLCVFLMFCTGKNANVDRSTTISVSANTNDFKVVDQNVSAGLDEGASAPKEPDDRGYILKTGDMAPDFTLKTTDNKDVKLSGLRGKIVMLQFTASWCSVCRKEMPFIERDIWQKHKDNKKFALYGIDRDEPVKTVSGFVKKTGITYPVLLDPGANVFALYAEREAGITRNILIDEDGKIVMLTRLYNEEEFAALCKKIDELLKN